jgi:hypothetical protein
MYRLGFWRYVFFVWIVQYGMGIFVFNVTALYFRHRTLNASDIAENLFVWLLTGLVIGVTSYKLGEAVNCR